MAIHSPSLGVTGKSLIMKSPKPQSTLTWKLQVHSKPQQSVACRLETGLIYALWLTSLKRRCTEDAFRYCVSDVELVFEDKRRLYRNTTSNVTACGCVAFVYWAVPIARYTLSILLASLWGRLQVTCSFDTCTYVYMTL